MRRPHPRRDGEPELGDEPRRAQHPQRIVTERHLRRRRCVQNAGPQRRQTAQGIVEFGRAVRRDPHRHRVDGEIPPHQIVIEAVAESHLRVARDLIVTVGTKRGDLHAQVGLAHAERAELDPGVPQRLGPRAKESLHLFRAGVGGEIQVGVQPAQQRVAHAAPDEVQLVTRVSKYPAEVAQHLAVRVQRDLGAASSSASAAESGTSDEPSGHGPITVRRVRRERMFTAATIAWVSDGEQAKPRRRRGRRRGRRAAGPPEAAGEKSGPGETPARGGHTNRNNAAAGGTKNQPGGQNKPQKARPRRSQDRLRTVHETSAGGLVIDGIDGPKEGQVAALIGRIDRRGRMLWSLPKGHIELGETAEQTAIREVAEETGIQGTVLAALGSIDYWFVTEGRRVHKTVHHYLMRFLGGELSDEDVEVSEVAWVPLRELPSRLAYADERRLAEVAGELIDKLHSDGPARCRRCHAARRGGAPRRIRTPATVGPTKPLNPSPAGGRTAADKGRDHICGGPRVAATAVLVRLLAIAALLMLLAVSRECPRPPRAGAVEPGATPFLQVQIDSVTPDVVTTTSEPMVTVTGTVTQRRRPAGARCHGASRTRRGRHRVRRPAHQPHRQRRSVRAGRRLHHRGAGTASRTRVPFSLSYPLRSAELPSLHIEQPGVYPVMVNVNGTPDYGAPARLDDSRFLLPVLGVPPDPASESTADTLASVDATRHLPTRAADHALAAGRPAAAGRGRPRRHHAGAADRRRTRDVAGRRRPPRHAAVGGRLRDQPQVDPGGQVSRAMCLAVDPDLLVTVNAMTGGYVVNDAADAGPTTPTHPGTGQEAAVDWLNRLKALAQRMCVTPTTYAQADLDALHRVGDPGLSAVATNGAAEIVDQILGITSTRGATPRRRRPADRPGRRAALGAGADRRDRRRELRRADATRRARPPPTSTPCATRPAWSPHRSTRPSGPRWPAPAPHR